MLSRSKRRALTTDDLMHRQELGPHKRQKPVENEGEETLQGCDGSDSGEDSQSEGSSALDECGDDHDSTPGIPSQKEEDGDAFSRFSFKPRQDVVTKENTVPSHVSSLPLSFAKMGVSSSLVSAMNKMSIHTPTEIQAACIPPLLAGRDCIGNAKTGSGKTIAFAIPILQRLSVDPYGVFALVLTPTRELALQISEQFAVLGASLNIRTAVVIGGMDMIAQALELENRPHVVVATPGRIVDHLKSSHGGWDLSRIKFLVLDEADRLLTPTFTPELSYLFNVLPGERQTCLFTATLTPSIETIAEAPPRPGKRKLFMHRMTDTIETVSTLQQHYILTPSHVREPYLFYLLTHPPESIVHLRRTPPEPASKKSKRSAARGDKKKTKSVSSESGIFQPPPTIIFCARPRSAAYLTYLLKFLGIRSTALHSRLTQRERLTSLSLFRSSVIPVLISTDVGSRGLDIEEVALVINWDVPSEPEEYTHRVGRTARKGKGGVAVSFVTEKDEEKVLKIEGRINTKLSEMVLPEGQVLEGLNAVSTAKRLANMELHDSDFGKREEIHRIKNQKRKSDLTG
ncbi:DEAD-domain-containing protein [Thelephora ganbajun]|uniref:DEAD-domain-containing protein n=1 Tax=Thelephora ganbajun TaxID=370292 RepID=A0ACB6Z6I2_THEGA|nr:DEAD-domain-containing protein [Thelephora ganbajun]